MFRRLFDTHMLSRSTYASALTIIVGQAEESFTIHEDTLCTCSKFFKATVSKDWVEAQAKTVHLTEQEPWAFKIYLESQYADTTDILALATNRVKGITANEIKRAEKRNARFDVGLILCQLWVLGDFLGDTSFKNDVMASLVRGKTAGAVALVDDSWEFVWEHTLPQSPLQKFQADYLLPHMKPKHLEKSFPESCLKLWLKSYMAGTAQKICENRGPIEDDLEKYLEH